MRSGRAVLSVVFAAAMLAPVSAGAQEGAITGRIVEEGSQAPIAGAAVQLRGTGIGTFAKPDGTFRIGNLEPGSYRVRVTHVGHGTVTRSVSVRSGQATEITIRMPVRGIEMDEIVATVQVGAVRQRETGFDVGQINAVEAVETGAIQNFNQLLNARAPNVDILRGSGLTGMGSRVRIRGANSLTQDNNPLIILDGVRLNNTTDLEVVNFGGQTTSRLSDLNPSELQSVQVMKGPTAAALYGSEAAAGVLVLETKEGESGGNRWTVSIEQGFVSDEADYPSTFADVTDFGVTSLDDPRISQFDAIKNPVNGRVFVEDNPFMDEDSRPFRNGWNQEYEAAFSGGQERVQYYTSGKWERQEGTFPSNVSKRLNLRGNVNFEPFSWAQVDVNGGYVNSDLAFPDNNSIASGIGVGGQLGFPLTSFGTDPEDGPGAGVCLRNALTPDTPGPNVCEGQNGLFQTTFEKLATLENREEVERFTGGFTGRVEPLPWLTSSLTVGLDETQRRILRLFPFDPDRPFDDASLGDVTDSRRTNRIFTVDWGATFDYGLGEDIGSVTSVGAQLFDKRLSQATCNGDEFPAPGVRSCGSGKVQTGSSQLIENVEAGAYAQQRFSFRDYLFATGALRIDDNSALGAEQGLIYSPSANASAVLSDMPFWNVDFISQLRLRFAWGQASQSPGEFAADRTFVDAPAVLGGQVRTGASPSDPGNPDLGPEETEEFEAGFEAGLLDDRVSADFSYFSSTTEDVIVPKPVAPSTGFPEVRFVNLGALENEGIEVTVNGRLLNESFFTWDMTFMYSSSDPVITDLGRQAPIIFPQGAQGGSRVAGSQVFQTGFAPGAYISRVITDAERNENGEITDVTMAEGNLGDGSPRRVVGSPLPTNKQTLRTTMTLFGGDLRATTLVERTAGHQILNTTRAFRTPFIDAPGFSSFSREWALRQANSTPEEQAMFERRFIAPFVEDGDWIKWREVTLNYRLPPSVVSLVPSLGGATLTFGARNLATITDFSGLDPEGNVTGASDSFVRNNFATVAIPNIWFTRLQVRF